MKNPESLLRENVRALISLVKKKNKNTQSEEQQLRAIIREFLSHELKEAKTPDNDPAPHQSTGINVLEDLLKKIIPQIEDDYKLLTTSEEQRESYRSHIIDAVVKTLTPVGLNNDALGDEPKDSLDEDIDIDISDDDDEKDDMLLISIPKSLLKKRKKKIHGTLSVSKVRIPQVETWRIQLSRKLNLKSSMHTICSPIPKIKKFSLTT